MAKARMLHKTISISKQVNELSLKAQLLYTWMIPHADDDGRMKGDSLTIKAQVLPMKPWSSNTVEKLLNEIKNKKLIFRWEEDSEVYIQFPTWLNYQQIKSDRYKPSQLPSYNNKKGESVESARSSSGTNMEPQYNISESSSIEVNKSESNAVVETGFAGITTQETDKSRNSITINPKTYKPSTPEEAAAFQAWEKLEPGNPMALKSTYLKASKRGLPKGCFYQFVSEIVQDPSVRNKGKVFNKKVECYFKK